ncbi:MAG: TonB-dependent receptor plug domain-containing protein [Janthinobacterium lividum]
MNIQRFAGATSLSTVSRIGTGVAASMLLLAGAAPAMAQVSQAAPASASDTTGPQTNQPTPISGETADPVPQAQPAAVDTTSQGKDVVVTGSLFRNAAAATASPITVVTSADLAARGINTVSDAVQQLAANNGGTLNSNWSQFGFPKGASAPSLRGLTDGRTLTLFDGLRSAPYPLADDGFRNFVDINTIPDAIVDRVEVLKDGASSTYGADAVAGVVNIIIKKEITGIHANASAGISERGDYGEQRGDLTVGYGKLAEQGFNFYLNGEYQQNNPLYLNARGFPYGTSDQSSICGTSNGGGSVAAGGRTCANNGVANGIQADGSFAGLGTTTVPLVRPYNSAGTAAIPGSTYQFLNPAGGCQNLTAVNLNAAQRAANPSAPGTVCQQDLVNQYYQYSGNLQRIGGNAHLTVNIGSHAQAYAMFNFYQTRTTNPLTPEAFAGQTAAGGTQVLLSPLLLPVYVCPRGTTVACTGANGTLNAQNPFAALGQQARIIGRYDLPTEDDTLTQTFRYTAGINGSFGANDSWHYTVDATHSNAFLRYESNNYIFAQHLLDVVADGSYNFINPSANSQAERNYLAPVQVNNSVSSLSLVQASLAHSFFTLPGGDVQLAVGGAYRHEAITNPSANAPNEANPYNRYYGINAVGVLGKRDVESGYFELDVPVVTQLDLKASGRYDHYSTGQSNFSPKFEAQFKPISQLKLRGTYSRGFAIASFNAAFGLPTTGYVNSQIDGTSAAGQAFIAAHGGNSYSKATYSYGLTSTGNPDVRPEKSEQYTLGAVLEPTRFITLTVDYYHIKIKDLITTPDCSAAYNQYYANNGVTNIAGCTTTAGVPDTDHPGALPLLGDISSSYTNANSLSTHGLDFDLNARVPLPGGVRLTSNLDATYLMYLAQNLGGTIERFDGTLSPCNITSCSGSPKWRGTWQNTLDFNGKGTLSATVNYTSGYELESTDSPYSGTRYDCGASIGSSVVTYSDGSTPISCRTPHFIDVDMTASVKVQDKFTLYLNVLNILDVKAPYDPSAGYSLYQFNPAWAGQGFIGRYFRAGARVDF